MDGARAPGSGSNGHVCSTVKDAAAACADQNSQFLLDLLPVSCWSLVVDLLSARDLLCLALASRSIKGLLCSVPGLWVQAWTRCLSWQSSSAAPSSHANWSSRRAASNRTGSNTGALPGCCSGRRMSAGQNLLDQEATVQLSQRGADYCAHQVLSSLINIAHITQNLKPQLRPQIYTLPPWLATQPGKARGFTQVQSPGLLQPAIVLTEQQLHWLSWGYLSGHSGGIFVSQCSCSPRSRNACGLLAAVVINKQLLAELYFPHSGTAPDRWSCVHESAAGQAARRASAASSASCGTSAQAQVPAAQFELWLSQLVVFDTVPASSNLAATGRTRGRRNAQSRGSNTSSSGRTAGSSSSGVPWRQVHALLMECIASNASRVRAVTGTAAVPPGSSAAAALEHHLACLVSAGAPVLDLRRMQYHSSTQSPKAAALSEGSCETSGSYGCTGSRPDRRTSMQQPPAAPGLALLAAQQQWRTATAAVQAAISAVTGDRTNNIPTAHLDDDCLASVLAEVVQQLHRLAPDVQILVLPILLPGGRVGQKVPRGSAAGSRLSAPRLLSLNVPYLVPLRYEWDDLPQLKQVLLLAGPPAALPQPAAVSVAGSTRARTGRDTAELDKGGSCSGKQLLERLQLGVAREQVNFVSPPLVRGVFLQEHLEQQWHQQVVNQQVNQQHDLQQQWDEDEWFQHQIGEQQQQHVDLLQCCWADATADTGQPALNASDRQFCCGIDSVQTAANLMTSGVVAGMRERAAQVPEPSTQGAFASIQTMPGYAVEAVHGMLLSCMDRLGHNSCMQ